MSVVKRKKIIVVLVGCILAVVVYLFCYMNENAREVQKEWVLSDSEVSKIEVRGLSQRLDLCVKKSDGRGNRVIVRGKMPESFADKIESLEPQKDSFVIDMMTSWGVSIAKNTKDILNITICLEDQELLKQLTVRSNKGDVNLTVPEEFQAKYELSTSYGEIKAPKEQTDTKREVSIELGSGDITVQKE